MKNNSNSNNILLLCQAALIAALYIVLTFLANAMGLAKNYLEVYLEFEEASNPRNRGEDVNLELKRIANSRLGRLLIKVIMKLRINKLF